MNEDLQTDPRTRTVPVLVRWLGKTACAVLATVLLLLPSNVTGLPADCIDQDGDGYGAFGDPSCPAGSEVDCDDTNGAVYPGAPEICDGVNNDCDHPNWPLTVVWETVSIGSASVNSSACAADLDGDDDLDVVLNDDFSNDPNSDVYWYENNLGDGSEWEYHLISDGDDLHYPRSVKAADLDGDGDMDVVVGRDYTGMIRWYENVTGNGSVWDGHDLSYVPGGADYLFVADLDGDDDIDLLSTRSSSSSSNITWHENTAGNGSNWSKHDIPSTLYHKDYVFVADVDGDGDLDVLSADRGLEVAWYENALGDGSEWVELVIPSTYGQGHGLFAADVDGDGAVDVLSADQDEVVWHENTVEDGSEWVGDVIGTRSGYVYIVFAADLDGDGDLDVLSRDDDETIGYENAVGDGSVWTYKEIPMSCVLKVPRLAADLDGDGRMNVLVTTSSCGLSFFDQVGFDGDFDEDGLFVCAGDCDDANPNCTVDCTDADDDGFCVTFDCDDKSSSVHPGAPEANDGIDNQCPGSEGHGLIDEISDEAGFHDPGSTAEYSWPAQPGATQYEVARFADPGGPTGCTTFTTADSFVIDPEEPVSGSIFHYLVRALAPHTGSWGQDSAGVERTNVCP